MRKLLAAEIVLTWSTILDVCLVFDASPSDTAWKLCIFGVFLVHIFPYSDWIQRDTEYLSVLCPNAGKHGQGKLQIRTIFTQSEYRKSLHETRKRVKSFSGLRFVEIIYFTKKNNCRIIPLSIFPSGIFLLYIWIGCWNLQTAALNDRI